MGKTSLDAKELARRLSTRSPNGTIFADSSVFDNTTDPRLWDALFDRSGGITLLKSVQRELAPWLDANPGHAAAQAIRLQDSSIDIWDGDLWNDEDSRAYSYYARLLGARKRVYAVTESRMSKAAEDGAADAPAVWARVHQEFGERGSLLAKKGREAGTSPNKYTDERLVTSAVLYGLRSGRPTCILTKDEDVLEQFYKLLWLIDTHYRGYLQAERLHADPGSFSIAAMPMSSGFAEAFDGNDNLLVERRSLQGLELLPEFFDPIELTCLVVGKYRSELRFNAETPMRDLIRCKNLEGAPNTDRFEDRNCHWWLPPIPVPKRFWNYAAIARDRRIASSAPRVSFAALDINHAVQTCERFSLRT